MRILEVIEACGAGVGRHVRGLCEALVAQGHDVTVAYSPYRTDEQFRQFVANRRTQIRFVPLKVGRKVSPISDLLSIVALLRLIRSGGPFDVIHGHSSRGGAIARIAGRLSNIPTVYTPHSVIVVSPEISRVEAVVYALVERILGFWATSRVIAVSQDELDFILKLKLVPENNIELVVNGIEEQDFEYFSEKIVRGDPTEAPLTFGTTLRFSAQKAPGNLIEAFSRLKEELPQVPLRLLIAGDGELFHEAEEYVKSKGLDETVVLLGWKTDVKEVLRELDVFVVPSLYEAGLSYSTMEAMAARLPIVSTSVFGAKGMLSRVPGNVLVPPGDPDALAEGMRTIASLTEPKLLRQTLRKIGQSNRDYVRSHFDKSEATLRTLQIYRTLCHREHEIF